MDLYARLLKEKEEEEHRRGRPLGHFRGIDSKVLDRKLNNPPEDQPRMVSTCTGFTNTSTEAYAARAGRCTLPV
jgi:hypothetical protein